MSQIFFFTLLMSIFLKTYTFRNFTINNLFEFVSLKLFSVFIIFHHFSIKNIVYIITLLNQFYHIKF